MWDNKVFPKHFYIHWPFCRNKCHYCDFVSFAKHDEFTEKYHEVLCNEIETFARNFSSNIKRKVSTIFFGGGTPSIYPLNLLEDLFKRFNNLFEIEEQNEITIEVNPKGVDKEKLETWRRLGINRLSIGCQVLDDEVLQKLNRFQTKKDFFDLMQIAPDFFSNISVDLILGLPGVSQKVWQETLEQITALPIQHISVYFLTIHENTPLFYKIQKGEIAILEDDEFTRVYIQTVEFLEQKGFKQYEISNFAKLGFESKHNQAYWERKTYRGFGLGAASFDGKRRFVNIKNLSDYLNVHGEKDSFLTEKFLNVEELDAKQECLEKIMLGLRQKKGIDLHHVLYCLNKEKILKKMEDLEKEKLIVIEGNRIVLTVKGMAIENEVILSFLDN